MEKEYKNKIYDRLLEIKFKININAIPNPQQVNEKIGECHSYIEEVSHFSIQIHKEMAVMQQAYNNALVDFELKKDTLLTQEPIKSLPNIKDREARSNLLLRKDRERVKDYQNNLSDLNNLLKAVSLKIRNLNTANADIKLQLRVLEAQVKLGTGPATSAAAKSLMEEMSKSTIDKDSFEDALSETSKDSTVDPSVPIDIEDIFIDEDSFQEKISESERVPEKYIEPMPDLSSDEKENKEGTEEKEIIPPAEKKEIPPAEEKEIPPTKEWAIDEEKKIKKEESINEKKDNEINLDNVIDINKKGGIETKRVKDKKTKQKEEIKKEKENESQKENSSNINSGGIDLDDLLKDFT